MLIKFTHGRLPFPVYSHTIQNPATALTRFWSLSLSIDPSLFLMSLKEPTPSSNMHGIVSLCSSRKSKVFFTSRQIGYPISQLPGCSGECEQRADTIRSCLGYHACRTSSVKRNTSQEVQFNKCIQQTAPFSSFFCHFPLCQSPGESSLLKTG